VQLTLGGQAPRLAALGPDAWRGEWGADYLCERLALRHAPLKAVLLDQSVLAGIGNIYADEILWAAGLSPLRQAGTLARTELERLVSEIRLTLEQGVRLSGCSISDFVDTTGRPGTFQRTLRAYGRQGATCLRCGHMMVRVVIAGRGTAYCPGCQA
jgi:formamidopyrimidine-DNA glycosylase